MDEVVESITRDYATALALARQNPYVLVHDSTALALALAEAVVADIQAAGGRADGLSADLGTADGPHALAAATREALDGRLDILVANAGIAMNASIDDMALAVLPDPAVAAVDGRGRDYGAAVAAVHAVDGAARRRCD
ncbi:SDR family NAD(P)-dependent oxidoreductase [Burkholderia pyrrocinia]|uniref:SDR family NAD(P)-dependent oxidoreductase n=1 Tax=Burkholderia pyrrocinia TaxID=60550 RepID=UPI0015751121|nr:SDR family NAD(P)-dependent oxidoreductase [Burkholderia pyrrocinia]NTX26902.1 SDR family NAD(P)-dependent oxidoreductase [Burkholderia pyrrocinia]